MREELVIGPLTVFVAPANTTFPDVDADPAGDWTKLGTNGNKNITDAGVVIEHNQTIAKIRSAGSTAIRKVARTEEDLLIRFTLEDLSPTQYAKILNDASIATTAAGAGQPGIKQLHLMRGLTVATFALLARGQSPVDNDLVAQYEVPICYDDGSPKPAFVKGAPAGLECVFTAIEDDTLGYGVLTIQTAAPTS